MDPLEQFHVIPLIPLHIFGMDISFTNASLAMVLSAALVCLFLSWGMRGLSLIPSRRQAILEKCVAFVDDMTETALGEHGKPLFPYIFAIFAFIVSGNILGLIPHVFTFTSQIIIIFGLSFLIFCSVTVMGILHHGPNFRKLFSPPDVPNGLKIILVPIEILSYCFRPVSLGLRLCANMVAGHVVLKIFAHFCVVLGSAGILAPLAFVPLFIHILLVGFELFIAILQAYVFSVLTCIYLRDAYTLH